MSLTLASLKNQISKHNIVKVTGLILGPVLFILFNYVIQFDNIPTEARAVLSVTTWVAVWWITEPIPIPATSLLPIVLLPTFNGAPIKQTTAAYGDKMLFLFMGGFIIALAIEKWNLHKRIALTIVNAIGGNARLIVLGFMVATGFMSMWISNTASCLMMITIAIAIMAQVPSDERYMGFKKSLLLGIAYSASIGGMATLVGTPTNPILVSLAKSIYNVDISFTSWITFGFPLVVILVVVVWFHLTTVAFKLKGVEMPEHDIIQHELKAMGRITHEEKRVLAVFIFTAIAWITRPFLIEPFVPGVNDTVIAIFSALLLFAIPANENERLIDWELAKTLPWGVIILFGGGLSIAAAFRSSGLALWLGDQFTLLGGINLILLTLIIVLLINFMTEITSNVATASIMLPVLASMSDSLEINPFIFMIGATLAASCAFMLPVATAANAIVFSTGSLKMRDMISAGFILNLFSALLIAAIAYLIVPALF